MSQLSNWNPIALFVYETIVYAALALIYAGPVLLALATLLLALPATRRQAKLRRTAYGLLAIDLGLLVLSIPMLTGIAQDHRNELAFDARTHHLTAPQSYGGIAFPPGTTVHLSEDGTPEFGTLPAPTPILGLTLTGQFRLGTSHGTEPLGIESGTLTEPADIQGIPCNPGPVTAQQNTVHCTLARDTEFAGHLLAAASPLLVSQSPVFDPPWLAFGTLARPEPLFDVQWPPGTIIGRINARPDRMAHGDGPKRQTVELCLPPGLTADIPGATLHGPLAFSVDEGRRLISPECPLLPHDQAGTGGYVQAGADRYDRAERPDAHSAWQWQARSKPGAPCQAHN